MRTANEWRGARRALKMAALMGLARDCAGPDGGFPFGGRGGPFGGRFGGRHGGGGGPDGPRGGLGGGLGGGGGRGRRGRFDRAGLRLLLLRLIADQPRHGYDLIRALEERSGGVYAPSPGVIYPALALLADEGLIAEQPAADQRRRFAITPAGEAQLADHADAVVAAFEQLSALAARAERNRAPQVERATANLATALRQRLDQGGAEDLPHAIAEILDEAARRIERL